MVLFFFVEFLLHSIDNLTDIFAASLMGSVNKVTRGRGADVRT